MIAKIISEMGFFVAQNILSAAFWEFQNIQMQSYKYNIKKPLSQFYYFDFSPFEIKKKTSYLLHSVKTIVLATVLSQ